MSDWSTQRAHLRQERRLPVTLTKGDDDERTIEGFTENLSPGGAFVTLQHVPFIRNERIQFEIRSQDKDAPILVGDAEVRWVIEGGKLQGCGLEFRFTSPLRQRLESLISGA